MPRREMLVMRSYRFRQIASALIGLSLLLSAFYFGYKGSHQLLRARSLIAARNDLTTYVPVRDIRDSELLDGSLYRTITSADNKGALGGTNLLAVVAAVCQGCAEASEQWEDLVNRLGAEPVHIRIVSLDGVIPDLPALRRLAQRKVPFRVISPKEPIIFGFRTGIRGVPMAVVLKGTGTVSCILNGVPSQGSVKRCAQTSLTASASTFIASEGSMTPWFTKSAVAQAAKEPDRTGDR